MKRRSVITARKARRRADLETRRRRARKKGFPKTAHRPLGTIGDQLPWTGDEGALVAMMAAVAASRVKL